MVELSGTEFEGLTLPKSFGWTNSSNILWSVMFVSGRFYERTTFPLKCTIQPIASVLLSEVFVDWLKHAFITKFNHIRPSVYERYTDILCRDLAVGSVWSRSTRKVF